MQGGGGGIVPLGISGWWTLFSVQGRRRSPAPPTETTEPPRSHWPGRSPAWWTADANQPKNKQINNHSNAGLVCGSGLQNSSDLNAGAETTWTVRTAGSGVPGVRPVLVSPGRSRCSTRWCPVSDSEPSRPLSQDLCAGLRTHTHTQVNKGGWSGWRMVSPHTSFSEQQVH